MVLLGGALLAAFLLGLGEQPFDAAEALPVGTPRWVPKLRRRAVWPVHFGGLGVNARETASSTTAMVFAPARAREEVEAEAETTAERVEERPEEPAQLFRVEE